MSDSGDMYNSRRRKETILMLLLSEGGLRCVSSLAMAVSSNWHMTTGGSDPERLSRKVTPPGRVSDPDAVVYMRNEVEK